MSDMTRQEAIDTMKSIQKYFYKSNIDSFLYYNITKALDMAIETLQAEDKWIPCSERLPSEDGNAYIVTHYCPLINSRRTRIAYCYANKDGVWSDTPKGYEVVAWMPLPMPYREESEVKE